MIDLGILGGGQLGRMTAMAAARLGLSTLILDPDPHCCAGQVSNVYCAQFTDLAALEQFSAQVKAITLEFENIPANSVRYLSKQKPMHPSADILEICQDRLLEKTWLTDQGLTVAPYAVVDSLAELQTAIKNIGGASFLKTRRFGYDGKGQVRLNTNADQATCNAAWQALQESPCILEGLVPFEREVSLIIARNAEGDYAQLPLVENQHENLAGGGKILRTTIAPATASQQTISIAENIGRNVAKASGLVGVLALELFLLTDGSLVVNEMAPRPHNSGHWSIEGASSSQFDLLVRAACGLPLPKDIAVSPCTMRNLLGDEANDLAQLLSGSNHPHVHIYGKGAAKIGRKMGHVTWKR